MIQLDKPDQFFSIQKKFPHIPFTQSEGWYNYQNNSNSIVFFVDNEIDPKIALWGREQKIPLSKKKILRIEGEAYYPNLNEKMFRQFYSKLLQLNYFGIEINSNNNYNINYEIGIRRAGFKRPLALHACPLTIVINLQEEFQFDRNWKRNMKKAIMNNLLFEELKIIQENQIDAIIKMFSEMADLKNLRYKLEHHSFRELLSSPDIRTFVAKQEDNKFITARIVHINNNYASDVIAANSLKARETGATYFIMENILTLLKKEEKEFFDFGRIPPSNHETDSVYNFKNASRGKKTQYNGEWAYYNNPVMEGLMYVYKRIVLKKQRY